MEAYYTEIPRVRRGDLDLLPLAEVAVMARVAQALSEPLRLQMLYLLSQREDLCTCEFEELLGLSQSKVSYHLNVLLQAGLVMRENRGTWSHHRLRSQRAVDLTKELALQSQDQSTAITA